jgi:hypothetical protein
MTRAANGTASNGDGGGEPIRPPAKEDRSDEELMAQLAAGRPEALASLHSRYATLVFVLAARSLDRAAAEEISQDVFLAVWQHASHQGRWTLLGRAALEDEGRSLIIAEGPALRTLPEQVAVTLEPIDHRAGAAPSGPQVVVWPPR